ncbi:hypothetical protein SUDANB58_05845 (plasmid) [Streptomyces sp. enrichment culture]
MPVCPSKAERARGRWSRPAAPGATDARSRTAGRTLLRWDRGALPARNELFGYGPAVAYLEMRGERVDTEFEVWRELITEIRALELDSCAIAGRLRSLRLP